MAVSHEDRIVRALRAMEFNKASLDGLAAAVAPHMTEAQVVSAVNRLDVDTNASVGKVHGGVQYFGVETGKRPGLYKEIKRGIERRWAHDSKLGSSCHAFHTSHNRGNRDGSWIHPDLVLRVQRRANAAPPVTYHAIEIEQVRGFDIKSVYQAFEQGRGADFRWVFFTGAPRAEKDAEWIRICEAAQDIGVGLVHAPRPTAPAAWHTIVKARTVGARPSTEQREKFLLNCGLTHDLIEAEISR